MSHDAVLSLDSQDANEFFDWIAPLQCQEDLRQLRIIDYPMIKPEARSRLHKDLYRIAYPPILRGETKPLTLEDLARMANG